MDLLFNQINLFYKEVFLQNFKLNGFYSLVEIKKELDQFSQYNFFIQDVNALNVLSCNIDFSYFLNSKICNIEIQSILNEDSLRIIEYLDLLEFLSKNDFIDKTVSTNKIKLMVSYAGIIADRNYEIVKQLFRNLQNKESQLVCSFLLRDLIENIKLYLYFIIGNKKEIYFEEGNNKFLKIEVLDDISKQIDKVLSETKRKWNFDISNVIKNNPSLGIWQNEFKIIQQLNDQCNSIIHKNGITKIIPYYVNFETHPITLKDVFYCIKFFFTLIVCYDGKCISSYDYIDYLDSGEEPPKDAQFWVAPICENFIKKEYSEEEIQKLRSKTYMDI